MLASHKKDVTRKVDPVETTEVLAQHSCVNISLEWGLMTMAWMRENKEQNPAFKSEHSHFIAISAASAQL